MSVAEIASHLGESQGKVNYWIHRHWIPKRTISEAVYDKWNPGGDPFVIRGKNVSKDFKKGVLYGLGVGLYWGEGTKLNKNSVRLGNTDPDLIKIFIRFLKTTYKIDESKLRFGLQIFTDMDHNNSQKYWRKVLGVPADKFYKTVVTPSSKIGTYRNKTRHGVLTVYFNNTKLKKIIDEDLSNIEKFIN